MNGRFHEMKTFRNKNHVFKDRWDAGRLLAQMIGQERGMVQDSTTVFAIPAGGVPVGLEISKKLNLPFDCLIVRKIPIPGNTEAGFGAVTLEGNVFLNQELLYHLRLSESQVEQQVVLVKEELQRRNALFRGGRPLPDLAGKTVILADDGLASGYTMMASIHTLKDKGSRKIIVAVPTAPARSIEKIRPLVEAVYCANIRETFYFAVADAYQQWYDLSQKEVVDLLQKEEEKESSEN